MWTGTSALKNIDQTLQTIRNDVVRLDTQLTKITESLGSTQRYRLKIINDIAAVRLVELESGELQQDLTSADRQAGQILEQRNNALLKLNAKIEDLNQQIVDAEVKRDALLIKVNESSQQIVESETLVQNQLKVDTAYLSQLDVARNAESVAAEASSKAEQAQAVLDEKAEPYKEDSLFMYLWGRGFGTTEYSGSIFSRFVDGWVARLIDYEAARVNFWNLTEIPKRLAEHAQRVSATADERLMDIQQLEIDALALAGVRKMETEVAALRETLDQHDDSLELLEETLNASLADRALFMAGEDEYIVRCVQRLTQAMDSQNLRAINRYVLATNSPTDDQLLIELQGVDDRLSSITDQLGDVRLMHEKKINKLKELEQVRRSFKDSRYDDVRSGFGSESILTAVLGQFLQGVVSGSDLWRTIQRNQRYRNVGSVPDFGSGGLGSLGDLLGGPQAARRSRRSRGSSWHIPTPRRSGGGFNLPRGGSGGGFKTGGSF